MREENNLFNLTDKIEEVQAFSRADDISKSIGLQEDTVLQGRYIIEKKISQNSESFSYLGFDKVHDKKIHIREFFPKDFCKREKDFSVTVENKDEFNIYLSDFLGFFRSIAKLKEVAVVQQVYDIFKENSTAYVVSEWIEGMTFERFIEKNNEPMTWEEAKYIFMPVLSALRTINSLKVQHLGVSPEHLIIGQDSKMHLIGFSTKNACQCGNFSTWQISKIGRASCRERV